MTQRIRKLEGLPNAGELFDDSRSLDYYLHLLNRKEIKTILIIRNYLPPNSWTPRALSQQYRELLSATGIGKRKLFLVQDFLDRIIHFKAAFSQQDIAHLLTLETCELSPRLFIHAYNEVHRLGLSIKQNEISTTIKQISSSPTAFDALLTSLLNEFESSAVENSLNNNEIIRFRIFSGYGTKTLEELGQEFGISRERIRQQEAELIALLRYYLFGSAFYIEAFLSEWLLGKTDLFPSLHSLHQLFGSRDNLFSFLALMFPSTNIEKKSISLRTPEPSNWREIRDKILLHYQMPISSSLFNTVLKVEFGFLDSQISVFVRSLAEQESIRFLSDEQLVVLAPNKQLAVANIALGFPNGVPWRDLAQVTNKTALSKSQFREHHSPCLGITSNDHLYLSGRGIYRSLSFFPMDMSVRNQIIDEIADYHRRMTKEIEPLSTVFNELGYLKRGFTLFEIRHIVKNDPFLGSHIRTKSGQMLLCKKTHKHSDPLTQKDFILSILRDSKEPLTKFQIADKLISKSENFCGLLLSRLLSEGTVVRVDALRYCARENLLNEKTFLELKSRIATIISKNNKIISGEYLKEEIESTSEIQFTRFFYASLSLIVAKEQNFYWRHQLVSATKLSDNFSLRGFIAEISERNKNLSTEEIVKLVQEQILIGREAILAALYSLPRRFTPVGEL